MVFCFAINEPRSDTLYATPLHTGVFPIGQLEPGKYYSREFYKVIHVHLELKEYYGNDQILRSRPVSLNNTKAGGQIEVTISEENRFAGKISIDDGNLSVIGNFDCPFSLKPKGKG